MHENQFWVSILILGYKKTFGTDVWQLFIHDLTSVLKRIMVILHGNDRWSKNCRHCQSTLRPLKPIKLAWLMGRRKGCRLNSNNVARATMFKKPDLRRRGRKTRYEIFVLLNNIINVKLVSPFANGIINGKRVLREEIRCMCVCFLCRLRCAWRFQYSSLLANEFMTWKYSLDVSKVAHCNKSSTKQHGKHKMAWLARCAYLWTWRSSNSYKRLVITCELR